MAFETISSEKPFRGKAFDIRVDQVRLPNGKQARLDILEHVGSVVILPLSGEGCFWFIRQYRHAAGRDILELPAGTLNPGEEPLACAGREMREETGFGAEKLTRIGGFFLAPGYSTEYMHVYLASGLYPDRLPGDEDEILYPERIPLADLPVLLAAGKLDDAKSLAALQLAAPHLEAFKPG